MYYIVRTEVEPKKCKLGNEQKKSVLLFCDMSGGGLACAVEHGDNEICVIIHW